MAYFKPPAVRAVKKLSSYNNDNETKYEGFTCLNRFSDAFLPYIIREDNY